MKKANRSGGEKVRKVRRKPHSPEIMPSSKLKREMKLTLGELTRFLKIIRRVMREINDTIEAALDKDANPMNLWVG